MTDPADRLAAAKKAVEGVPEAQWEAIACAVYGPGTPTGRRTNLAVATPVQGTNFAPAVAAFIAFARNHWDAIVALAERAAGLEAEVQRLTAKVKELSPPETEDTTGWCSPGCGYCRRWYAEMMALTSTPAGGQTP